MRAVDYHDGDARRCQRLLRTRDAGCFEPVGVRANAGRVDQTHGDAADDDRFLDGVAGGAGQFGDDRALFAEQGVEQ